MATASLGASIVTAVLAIGLLHVGTAWGTSLPRGVVAPRFKLPIPTVIETDIGSAMDDTWSICYVLSRPDVFDLRLIVTATNSSMERAQIVAKLLAKVNRTDVHVGVGIGGAGDGGPQYPWAADYPLTDYPGVVHYNGTAAILEVLQQGSASDPYLFLEIAPALTLAEALRTSPSFAKHTLLSMMGGSLDIGYLDANGAIPEYNIVDDIGASQTVFSAAWMHPMLLAPLDTTDFFQIGGQFYQDLLASETQHPIVHTLLDNYRVFYANGGGYPGLLPFSPTTRSTVLYDAEAAYMAAEYLIHGRPYGAIATRLLPMVVNNTGFTIVSNSLHSQPAHIGAWWNGTQTAALNVLCGCVSYALMDNPAPYCSVVSQ